MSRPDAHEIRELVVARVRSEHEGAAWLEDNLPLAEQPREIRFRVAYAAARRRLRDAGSLCLDVPSALEAIARAHWTLLDWCRLALLGTALEQVPAAEQAAFVNHLFEAGELGEQESLLRTVGLLEGPERFVTMAISACRTNTVRVFEAIACENPYPAAYFPELHFNQMVLKAVFLDVSVRRIEELRARTTPELCRMARDYASERRAAGRPVPRDIPFILEGEAT